MGTLNPPLWPRLARLRDWRPQFCVERLILLTSVFFALLCNGLFWRSAMAVQPDSLRLAASLLLVLIGMHSLLMGLLVWLWNAKLVLSVLLLGTALAAYCMGSFHVYLDVSMLRNVLATDFKESRELMTSALIVPLLTLGLLPVLVVWRVRLVRRR